MDRRTQDLLAQTLQELEEGETPAPALLAASSQPDALRDHLETWDRLSALRPIDADRGDMAAGREHMFSALHASGIHQQRLSWVSLMSPPLRLIAVVAGILALMGAATGASVAVGGPAIWRTAGIGRSGDGAVERAEAGDNGLKAAESQATSGSASASGTDAAGPADAGGPASHEANDSQEDVYVNDEESESDTEGLASADEPSTGQELSGGAASATPDTEHDDEDGFGADTATPR